MDEQVDNRFDCVLAGQIVVDAESVTRQIDLAVAAVEEQDDSAADAFVVGRGVLADASGDW